MKFNNGVFRIALKLVSGVWSHHCVNNVDANPDVIFGQPEVTCCNSSEFLFPALTVLDHDVMYLASCAGVGETPRKGNSPE